MYGNTARHLEEFQQLRVHWTPLPRTLFVRCTPKWEKEEKDSTLVRIGSMRVLVCAWKLGDSPTVINKTLGGSGWHSSRKNDWEWFLSGRTAEAYDLHSVRHTANSQTSKWAEEDSTWVQIGSMRALVAVWKSSDVSAIVYETFGESAWHGFVESRPGIVFEWENRRSRNHPISISCVTHTATPQASKWAEKDSMRERLGSTRFELLCQNWGICLLLFTKLLEKLHDMDSRKVDWEWFLSGRTAEATTMKNSAICTNSPEFGP